jgi:hypothetical protein
VHLLDAGDFHGTLHRVHYPAVTAGGEHHQAAPFDVKAGGQFMLEIVRDHAGCALLLRKLVGETADPVSEADGHARGSQHFFEGGERDVAGGEGMAGEHRRRFREHYFDLSIGERLAVQEAEVLGLTDGPFARAEAFFPSQIQGKIGLELAAVLLEEAD